jgi:hypothetical protein
MVFTDVLFDIRWLIYCEFIRPCTVSPRLTFGLYSWKWQRRARQRRSGRRLHHPISISLDILERRRWRFRQLRAQAQLVSLGDTLRRHCYCNHDAVTTSVLYTEDIPSQWLRELVMKGRFGMQIKIRRRRDLYLKTHNIHKKQTSRTSAGFFFVFLFLSFCPFDRLSTFMSFVLVSHFSATHNTNIHASGGIRTRNPSKRSAADPHLRPLGNWNRWAAFEVRNGLVRFSGQSKQKASDIT